MPSRGGRMRRCDAEPAVLADYIIALLKKERSEKELQSYCKENLDDFLQDKTGVALRLRP